MLLGSEPEVCCPFFLILGKKLGEGLHFDTESHVVNADAAKLVEQADLAAARGTFSTARELLVRAVVFDPSTVDLWLKLATACRAECDFEAALSAVNHGLTIEPLHFLALLLRASLLEAAQAPDADEAYGRAWMQRPPQPLNGQLAAVTDHAEQRFRSFRERTLQTLVNASQGLRATLNSNEVARCDRFCSNAARVTKVYHSEPTDYHYPGLSEREFHEPSSFPWLEQLETMTDAIAREFLAVAEAENAELVPYIQYEVTAPVRQWESLNGSRKWTAIHLIRNGHVIAANARHCPVTMAFVAGLPQPVIKNASPNVMFSLLAADTVIPPHTGVTNTRLVCHLPLIVPPGCRFRVGSEWREWHKGSAWVFDDTIEHEAINASDRLRVVLIFDVWHPDLSRAEKRVVSSVIGASEKVNVSDL